MKKLLNKINELYSINEEENQFFNDNNNIILDDYSNRIIDLLIKFKLDINSIIAFIGFKYELQKFDCEESKTLCDNLKNLSLISHLENEDNNESIRRMFIAISKDLRVLIIKLCCILAEIEKYKEPLSSSQKYYLHQVEDIFAPLAERLGMNALKSELEDVALKLLNPNVYNYLYNNVMLKKEENAKQIDITTTKIKQILDELKINGTITARQKHFSSINKKMRNNNISLAMIYDLIALRVLVDTVDECYSILGKIHSIYKPMPGRFKDYIASPKNNGYQSLHTTIIAENERPLEIQIRTHDMHRYAEYGVAAHWIYKEKRKKQTDLDKKLTWIREIMENSTELSNDEFVDSLKTNLYGGVIFAQTPKGNVLEFPEGASVIDFAYYIHSEVGNKCVGAKINGRIVPLTTLIKNGDIIEIITSSTCKGPSRDWLKIAKTASARSKIHAFFKKELKEENIKTGRTIIELGLKNKNVMPSKVLTNDFLSPICRKFSFGNENELFASVGYGSFPANQIINRLYQDYIKEENKEKQTNIANNLVVKTNKQGVLIDGYSGMLIRYPQCCHPLEGDDIIGYISRGRGVTIHNKGCINVPYLEQERLITAIWDSNNSKRNRIKYNILYDGTDIESKITELVCKSSGKLMDMTKKQVRDECILELIFDIEDKNSIYKIFKDIANLPQVKEILKEN